MDQKISKRFNLTFNNRYAINSSYQIALKTILSNYIQECRRHDEVGTFVTAGENMEKVCYGSQFDNVYPKLLHFAYCLTQKYNF